MFLVVLARCSKSEVIPLDRTIMRDARREILYRASSVNRRIFPRTGFFFYIVAKNLENRFNSLTCESVIAALVRRLPRNDGDKDSRGKIHIETARKAAIVRFTTRSVLREKSIRRGYFVSTLQRTGAKSAPVRN